MKLTSLYRSGIVLCNPLSIIRRSCLRYCGGILFALLCLVFSATSSPATTYTLGTTSLLEGPAAGSSSVVLAASDSLGSWTAAANDSWLQVSVDTQSGTASANVIFSYDANTGATRTGTLTIAGQTLSVTQAGTNYVAAQPVTELASGFLTAEGVAVDSVGNVYIADADNNTIDEWTPANNAATVLVTGLNNPQGVAVDAAGNVYIADTGNNAIEEWTTSSGLTPLVSSGLGEPVGVAVDGSGNVYIADPGNNAIEEWTAADSTLTTNVSSGLGIPVGVAVDAAGNIYIADSGNNAIEEFTTNSGLTTLVSSGLGEPVGVAVDGSGNVYIADSGNDAIEEWTAADSTLTTNVSSGLGSPAGVAVDAAGNIYIADSGDVTLDELPYAFVATNSVSETSGAGTDALPSVLPATQNLLAPFAPTSDSSWLTITGITNGVVSFAFTANTGAAQTANISLLGQTIPVTQAAGPPQMQVLYVTVSTTNAVANGQSNPQDFGSVPYGSEGTILTFAVANVGGSNLTLQTPGLPAGFVFATNAPTTIAPGTNGTFSVQLSTDAAGMFFGYISITNNDPNNDPYTFAIKGSVSQLPVDLTGTRAYDGTSVATNLILSVTNVVGDDDVTVASGSGALSSPDIGANAFMSFGNLALGGPAAANYTLVGASGSVIVTPAPLTITALPQTIPYGATVPATTLTYSGFVNSETTNVFTSQPVIASAQTGVVAAGTYPGNYTVSGAADTNYSISYVAGDLVVNPPPQQIGVFHGTHAITNNQTNTINFGSVDYGSNGPIRTFTVTNTGGSNLVFQTPGLPAGYTFGTNAMATNISPGSSATFSVQLSTNAVGTYAGTISITNNDPTNSPFNFDITGTINPLPVVLTGTRAYDGTSIATNLILSVANVVGEDNVTVASGSGILSNADVGNNAITSFNTLALGGTAASNYTLVGAAGSVIVTAAPLTITALPQTINYGATVPTTTLTYNGFVNNETTNAFTSQPVISSAESGVAAVGSYPSNYTVSGAADTNYSITYVPGALTVNPASQQIEVYYGTNAITNGQTNTISFGSVEYGSIGSILTFTVTNSGGSNLTLQTPGLPSGFILATNAPTTIAPGTNGTFSVRLKTTAVGTFAGNISITNNAPGNSPFIFAITGTVNPLAVVLNGTRLYNGTAVVTNSILSVTNAVSNDVVTVVSGSGTLASATVGTNAITSFGNLALGGATATNYTLAGATGAVIVTAAPLTITALPQTITHGATVPTTTVTYGGFVNSETTNAFTSQPVISSVHSGVLAVGTYTNNYTVSGAVDTNYSITYVPGTLTVNPAPAQIEAFYTTNAITNGQTNAISFGTVEYGSTAPALVFTVTNLGDLALNLGTPTVPSGFILASNPLATVAGGSNTTFAVRLNSTNAGTQSGNISFTNNAVSNSPFVFPVTGFVATRIPYLGGNLAFGVVATNTTAQLSMTISNGGNTNLIVSNITYPSGFSGSWTNGVIAAGGSSNVTVTFSPTVATNYLGVVTIVSDKTGGANTLPISGFGGSGDLSLTVLTSGGGGVTPNDNGHTYSANSKHTLTAVASAGNLFSSWSGSINTNKNPLTFTLTSNMVLQANFVTNPFMSLSLIGTYNGLFSAGDAVTETNAGMLKNLTVAERGTYSGTLMIQGASYGITGTFGLNMQTTNLIKRAASEGDVVVEMTVVTSDSAPQITGVVYGTNNGTVLWQATNLLADLAGNAAPSAEYTVLLLPNTNDVPPNVLPANAPGGAGYLLITNDQSLANPTAAKATITGALADGTAFSQTAPVSQDGYVPIYASLYQNKGLILGWINLTSTNDLARTNGLAWIHPATSSGLYKAGFSNTIDLDQILISPWSSASFADVSPILTNLLVLGTIHDTDAEQTIAVSISDSGKITETSSGAVLGSVAPKTGLLKVTIGTGASKITGVGAILLNATNGGGYYLTKTNAQAIRLAP